MVVGEEPARGIVLQAMACDTALRLLGAFPRHDVERRVAELAPAVVVLDCVGGECAPLVRSLAALKGRPAVVAVVPSDQHAALVAAGATAVDCGGGSHEELLDVQGHIVGAIWNSASSRLKRLASR